MSHPNGERDPNQAESAHEPDTASDEVPGASDVMPVRLPLLPDGVRELPVPGDNTTPQGDRRRAHWSDAAGGKRVMVTYVPEALDDEDPAIVTEVMRATRAWVAQAGPHDALSARQMMWAVAPMAAWLLLTLGSLDVTMLNHRNVEVWINHVNKPKQSDGWRRLARGYLRRVGRKANPDGGWPPAEEIGRSPIAQPYLPEIEDVFRQVAEIPRPERDQAGRLWVAGGGCGAALNGVELSAAETGDLEERGNGRLVILVRGHRPRRVPIRAGWTETVRQAALLAEEREGRSPAQFIRSRSKNAVSGIAASLDFGEGGLNLRRARTTWLTAHLLAGTPLPDLRVLAGSLSAQTLIELIDLMVDEVDPEQAIQEGLRA